MEDKVTCKICGDQKMSLQAHLKFKHGINNGKYLELYPGAEIYSEFVRNKIKEKVNNRDPIYKKVLSEKIKDLWKKPEIRDKYEKGLKLAHNTVEAIEKHRSSALNHFKNRTEEQKEKHNEALKKSWSESKTYRKEKLKEAHQREDSRVNHSNASKKYFDGLSDSQKQDKKDKLKETWAIPENRAKLEKIIKIGLLAANSEESNKKRALTNKTPESKDKRRKAAVKRLANMPKISKLNIAFLESLNKANLYPVSEYPIGYYTVDFCFVDEKIVVEVDGDYWHCNPLIYSTPKNTQQRRALGKDRAEKDYLIKGGWKLLRFWETDINKDMDKCIKTVSEAVDESKR